MSEHDGGVICVASITGTSAVFVVAIEVRVPEAARGRLGVPIGFRDGVPSETSLPFRLGVPSLSGVPSLGQRSHRSQDEPFLVRLVYLRASLERSAWEIAAHCRSRQHMSPS